jgi:uncharacterized phage protein (TIGR02218 family)
VTYLADEAGPETSRPREVIRIVMALVEYRIATGTRDITVNGKRYIAGTSAREEVKLASTKEAGGIVIRLPLKHPVPQRWLAGGAPPGVVEVEILRQQLTSGEYERLYLGRARSLAVQDSNTVASIEVVARHVALLDAKLPRMLISRTCPFILYGQECRASAASFKLTTTVAAVSGRDVTLAAPVASVTWALAGYLEHTASGEQMLIYDQTSTTALKLRRPIYGMRIGDAVDVYAGCDRTFEACETKFLNEGNFGGFRDLPASSPHLLNINGYV